ncbi:unnamed protein product [Diatraea saccharalis]|uniref:Uncharacterized protein n=1 Tax=Diatraea saccharalis TaxID=40085 RepID=A0A9N9WBR7_9NEOP|nr:unnamed protein product [Diatraea saccharalis]
MIPDHLFDEGINNSLLQSDMKHVQGNKIVYERTQRDYVRYYRVTGENLQFPNLKTMIVIISIGCLLLAICFLLSLCALLDGFPLKHTAAYFHIITMINMNCALWFTNITIAVYGALAEIVDHGFGFSFKEMGLFVDAGYCCTLLFIFADCSHKSTKKVADGVQETLLNIDILAVDRPTQKEIDHFIQAIEMNPAVVSLKGYADVNRELLTSVRRN